MPMSLGLVSTGVAGCSWWYPCLIDCCFFFQAEDGIRDLTVTGVQTCALPISLPSPIRGLTRSGVSSLKATGPKGFAGDSVTAERSPAQYRTDAGSTFCVAAPREDRKSVV